MHKVSDLKQPTRFFLWGVFFGVFLRCFFGVFKRFLGFFSGFLGTFLGFFGFFGLGWNPGPLTQNECVPLIFWKTHKLEGDHTSGG